MKWLKVGYQLKRDVLISASKSDMNCNYERLVRQVKWKYMEEYRVGFSKSARAW